MKNPLVAYVETSARANPAMFAGYVGRDETSGAPLRLAPHHRKMHATWCAHDRSVVWAAAEFGKMTMVALRIAWELARNPALRVAIVGGTLAQGERIARAVTRIIESPQFLRVFPAVRRQGRMNPEMGWENGLAPRTVVSPSWSCRAERPLTELSTRQKGRKPAVFAQSVRNAASSSS